MRELYADHVDRLSNEISSTLAEHGYDSLVIHAGAEMPVSQFDDRMWAFNPTPAFAHLTPISEPGAAVLIAPGERPGLHRPVHKSYWDAPAPAPPSYCLAPFREISPADASCGRVAFIGEKPEAAAAWKIDEESINPAPLISSLNAIRAIKSLYEVESIAEANRTATKGHVALEQAFAANDSSEFSLHLRFLEVTNQDDAETPYKGIVALGRNAAVLHHNRYGREELGDLSLLVDAGAKTRGYAADVTRTHVKGDGAASRRFAALIAAIDRLQQQICSEVTPGLSFEILHDRTHELLAEVAIDVGIAKASPEELIDSGLTRALLPHGLGHSIGIQVHDVGCKIKPPAERNPFLRNTADITVGHVFTIEPGCYFIDSLLEPLREAPIAGALDWALISELSAFGGIRIEDNIAVTAEKTRNLTRDNWPSPP